jgi:glycosyltransferase involved in cell wall biosynthesis
MREIISIICPAHNEEKTIPALLESIFLQSKKPSEIIIVEDSSTDKTINILNKFKKNDKRIKIFQVKNKNISKNRNLAIEKSKGNILICVDAGCILDKDYIKNITAPFTDNKISFVGGISKIKPKNILDECFASFVVKENPSSNYLPKGHAMAFRKDMWKDVGGFPEHLSLGAEDTYFGKMAIKKGYTPFIARNAIIYWENRKDLKTIFKQFKSYGYWDAVAFKIMELPRNSKLSLIVAIVFPIAIIHAFLKAGQIFLKIKKIKSIYYSIAIDLAKIYGYFFGWMTGELK